MEKKSLPKEKLKLKLNRETLRDIGRRGLEAVAGGISTQAQCKKPSVPC